MSEDERFEAKGTSFFLNFHPLCDAHQQGDGKDGTELRRAIVVEVERRFLGILEKVLPKEYSETFSVCRIDLCHRPQPGFNNGEIFVWLDGLVLPEKVVYGTLSCLRLSFDSEPMSVGVGGEDFPVRFCGYGFRYLPSAKELFWE